MRYFLFLSLVAAACSSPGNPQQGDDQQPDAAIGHPDAPPIPPDAPPVLGTACPTSLHEVGRITGANLHIDDRGFYGPTYKQGLYTRDADGDGKADIISVEYVSGTVGAYHYQIRIFPQTATGFGAPITSAITFPGYGPGFNTIADVNGDHLADIIFEYQSESPNRHEYLYVATQGANHTFTLQPSVNVSACGSSSDERMFGFAVADVDKDGKDDVLTTVSYGGLGAAPAGVTLLKGGTSGLGSAQCMVSASVTTHPGFPAALVTAEAFWADDFDGDGNLDLVAAISSKLHLFRSTGASTYEAVAGEATQPTWRVTMTDHVGGRSKQDLVNADIHATDTTINRFTVGSTGVVAQLLATLPQGDTGGGYGIVRGVVAGDFNGDGLTDVFEVGNNGYSNGGSSPGTFALTCDRGSRADMSTGAVDAVSGLRAIDLDGNGTTEIAAINGSDVVIYAVQ